MLTGALINAARLAGRQLGNPDGLGLRHHYRTAARVLLRLQRFLVRGLLAGSVKG